MKLTIDLDGYTDNWDMQERFEEFYELVREAQQTKTGASVDRKLVRKAWDAHLKHIAAYFVVEYWDTNLDEAVQELIV